MAQEIEEQVEALEQVSSAEVVVCIQKSSDNYLALDLVWSILFGLAVLAYKIWSPYVFDPNWVVFNVIIFGLCGFALSRWGGLRRLLLRKSAAEKAVKRAAFSQFHALGVHQTRDRTGVLVFLSRYERALLVVPDSGLAGRISEQLWKAWSKEYGKASSERELLENLKALLQAFQGPFQRQSPRRADDMDELPNRMVES